VVRAGAEADTLVGSPLDQPFVLHPDGSTSRLDTTLGAGFTLLGVDVTAQDWAVVDAAFDFLPRDRLDIVLGDRRPRPATTPPSIGDADGELEQLLTIASGQFLLLRPDRYVAGVFPPARAEISAAALRRHLGTPATVPTATTKGAP
jgi:3-(3-hydroxy-phenyl)propionate hydroxylase